MEVTVSETYDLSTVVDHMGFVGVHTPQGSLIAKMWPGLIQNYKYMNFKSCDIEIACASMLPADPLQVGVAAGSIAPQDMFNPILYKAVSNDSMSTLVSQIYMAGASGAGLSFADSENSGFIGTSATDSFDQFKIYYSQLASDGWRKAMPQQGLSMKGLVPIVHTVVSNYGVPPTMGYQDNVNVSNLPGVETPFTIASNIEGKYSAMAPGFMRGPAQRMPRFPTTVFGGSTGNANQPDVSNFSDNVAVTAAYPAIPKTFVAAIVMPPAKLNVLYYRMRVTWHIEFYEPRPATDIYNWGTLNHIGGDLAYFSDYADNTKAVKASGISASDTDSEMVYASNAELNKVMESA